MANPYLDLVDKEVRGPVPVLNPYQDIIDNEDRLRRTQMSAAVSQALQVKPDSYAEQRRVAKALEYPVAVVEAMPDVSRQRADLQRVQQTASKAPALERAYTDADFARLAHDDTTVLGQVGDFFSNLGKTSLSGLQRGSAGAAGLAQVPFDLLAPLLDPLKGTVLPANPFRVVGSGLSEYRQNIEGQSKANLPKGEGNIASGFWSGVASLASNLTSLPLAFLPGGQQAALAAMVAPVGGQAYGEAVDKGLSPTGAAVFGVGQAAIDYWTEKLPIAHLVGDVKGGTGILKTLAKQLALELPGEQIATVLQDLNEWAALNTGATFGDYLKARPDAAIQTAVATIVGVGGNVAVAKGIESVARRLEGSQQVQQDADNVKMLMALAAQSKLRQRAPESFAALAQSLADETDGAPKVARFDGRALADVLAQSGLDEQSIGQMLPSVSSQIQEAIATGDEVVIPIGELTSVAGTPLEQALIENARIGQNELSQAEQKEADAKAGEFLAQESEKVISAAADVVATQQTREAIRSQIVNQLKQANRFTEDVNQSYAVPLADFFMVMAARTGQSAETLYARYAPKIQARSPFNPAFFLTLDGQRVGDVLNQRPLEQADMFADELATKKTTVTRERVLSSKGPEKVKLGNINSQGQQITGTKQGLEKFWTWFGQSAAEDNKGRPLLLYHSTNSDVTQFEVNGETTNNYGFLGDVATRRAGIFMTPSREFSQEYLRASPGQNVMPVYASLQNPLDLRQGLSSVDEAELEAAGLSTRYVINVQHYWELFDSADDGTNDFVAGLQAAGYDGAIFNESSSDREGKGGVTYVAFKAEQVKSALGNKGTFSPTNPSILEQRGTNPRGTFDPSSLTITINENANLSTFLHESSHFFLEVLVDIAAQPNAPADVVKDAQTFLDWAGFKGAAQEWAATPLDKRRKAHERWAESFEQYLLEGKAPSIELQPLFQKFRSWMISVYKSLTSFVEGRKTSPGGGPEGLGLSDDIRRVFDRLLATEEQIQLAQSQQRYAPLFKSAEQAGMTPEAWAAYRESDRSATEGAVDRLQARSMSAFQWMTGAKTKMMKALQKEAAGKRKIVEDEVTKEVQAQPVYQAQRWLRKGEMTTPEGEEIKADKGFRFNTEALAAMYPDSALSRPDLTKLKGMTAANGLHPDVVAEMFGFDSGDKLVRSIIDAEPMASVIEGMTDNRMLERYGDLATQEGIERAAQEAVHNDARGKFLAAELAALQAGAASPALASTVDKAVGRAVKKADTSRTAEARKTLRTAGALTLARAAKTFGENLIARRKIRDLSPGKHTKAEAMAARAAEQALAKGDKQALLQAKQDQILQHYAARASMKAAGEIERFVDYLKKFDKADAGKKLDIDYLDQIHKLLERVDLRQISNKASEKRAKLAAWIEGQKALGIEPDIPDYLLEDAQLTSYREMTVEQFRGLVDAVRQIEHFGRLKKKLLTAKDKREFDDIKARLIEGLVDNAKGREARPRTARNAKERWLQGIRNFGAAHIKVATLARIMDGGKDGGVWWEYLIRPANDAGSKETTMIAKATSDLAEILSPLLKKGHMGGKGTYFPSVNESFNRESVIAIALNTGNESNLQRLLGGEGWQLEQIQPILDTLTPEDWATVQKVWDYFESFRPEIAAKERRVSGKEPEWIEPGSSVTEAYGIKGGYYPVKFDPMASQRAEEHADAEGAKRQLQGAYGAATTRRSFTKSRVEEVQGRPLLYTLQGVYSGVQDVIHDLSWHEWLIDVNRLLGAKDLDSAIRTTYGAEAVRQIKSWRDDIAEGDAGQSRPLERTLGRLRQSVSIAGLGWNVMSAAMQPLGFTQSIQRIGLEWVTKGVMRSIGSPLKAGAEANALSPFMATRALTRFRELNELRNRVQGGNSAMLAIRENAYRMMLVMQRLVDVPTWWGAYEKAIAEGNDDARAVDLADQAVIDSQGGGQTKDLSAIERGGPALKLFTSFYSYMNTTANLMATSATTRSKGQFAVDTLLVVLLPAILGGLLKDALTPGDADDDDEATMARKMAAQALSYAMGLFVLGREIGETAKLAMGDNAFDYKGPTGLRAIADFYTFAKQAGQGEFDDQFRKATINLAGSVFGLPSAQINRSITGTKALIEGKTDNPAAPVFGYQEPR
jgi:hypothetical protein